MNWFHQVFEVPCVPNRSALGSNSCFDFRFSFLYQLSVLFELYASSRKTDAKKDKIKSVLFTNRF